MGLGLPANTRDRHIALTLAQGETTGATAKRFEVSAARVSQMRRQLADSWKQFHGNGHRQIDMMRTAIHGNWV